MAPANPIPPPEGASPQPGAQDAAQAPASHKDVGQIAVERGYCAPQQIADVREEQRKQGLPPETLGALLVQKGFLTQEQARACARATRGATLIGGFEILEKIGQGGMGVVFRARQISMDRIVALKILPPKLAQDPTFKKRFLHEAQVSARLSHINIINGIDCGEDRGYVFFAMEFVDGKTLKEILKDRDNGKLPPADAFGVVRQVAEALVYAESHSLVHRDIKPDNIMLTGNNLAKLCDLGLAKQTSKDDAALTREGHAVGTPYYISPEQARGEKTVDTRSDIYSLGATFFHLLTGKPPFEAPTGASVMALHITDEAKNPCDLDPLLPTGYGQVISKMMAKSPADRYASARELVEDLDAVKQKRIPKAGAFRAKSSCAWPRRLLRQQTGLQTPAGDKRATGPQKPTASRVPLAAVAVCALVLVGGGAYWLSTRNRQAEETKTAAGQPGEGSGPDAQTPPKAGGGGQAPAPSKAVKPPETTPKVPPATPAVPKKDAPDQPKTPPKVPEKDAPSQPAVAVAPDTTKKAQPPPETTQPDAKAPATDTTKKAPGPDDTPKTPVAPTPPPEPEEAEPPKLELTADMLYARFLGEFRKPAAKGDLVKFQGDLKELAAKPEFEVARADVNADLADLAAAIAFEQQALKAMATAGGTVELSEETARKFGVKKGKIVGFDQNRGLSVDANGPVFSVNAKDLPVTNILEHAPEKAGVASVRYLCARGYQSEAVAALKAQAAYLKPEEKQRWERKLRLMATGESEMRALAAYANLAKAAEAKSWRTFMKMLPDFEKTYGNTSVATEHLGNLAQWKAAARAAVAPAAEGLEATGKFAPVKWPNVNACRCEVVPEPDTKNKVLVIQGGIGASLLGEGDKSAVIRTEAPLDLTQRTRLLFRARHKNPKPLPVSIGFMFGVQFFEAEPVLVQPTKWGEYSVKIEGAVFKAAASGYVNFDQALPTRQPNALFVLVYTKDPYVLEVDSIVLK